MVFLENGSLPEANLEHLLDESGVEPLFALGQNLLSKFKEARGAEKRACRESLFDFLDLARTNLVLRKIVELDRQNEWYELLLAVIKRSNFTTGQLFFRRATQYSDKPLFQVIEGRTIKIYAWNEIRLRIAEVAKSLCRCQSNLGSPGPVAIWSRNSLDMAIIDLACLCYGIPNVLIPANSVIGQVEFILVESKAGILFASDSSEIAKVTKLKEKLVNLQHIVRIGNNDLSNTNDFYSFQDFLDLGKELSAFRIQRVSNRIKLKDLATVMYTSGTTESPKGIIFSHLNIVSKRFARAIALAEIGEHDSFLCYLPLFHTFGRWFEMMGCVFWGSTYTFIENPSIETIIDNMRRVKPTVFISIPKKWNQLHERIVGSVKPHDVAPGELRKQVQHHTGGNLKWGLSAAGFLDPEIFRFFQTNGVELMSGFGMTEATGGITMTPPQQYVENTVGKALPGIRIRLAKDGEMLVKGSYVMKGYFGLHDSGLRQGWFATGDIFSRDENGYYRIVDRKKEIYKNVKGETVAPQKIENLFRDFPSVQRVYLVGDHREYNTLLIYPNYQYTQTNLKKLDGEKLRDFFNSLVVSVNRFLAPYERVVDFTILGRDFSTEQGELTPKGTFKRSTIDENFREQIEPMYEKGYAEFKIAGLEITIPNRLLRLKGLTANDFGIRKSMLVLKKTGGSFHAKSFPRENSIVLGNCSYRTAQPKVDLGHLIDDPELWLGNQDLQDFLGAELFRRARARVNRFASLSMIAPRKPVKVDKEMVSDFKLRFKKTDRTLASIHSAALMLWSFKEDLSLEAIQLLESIAEEEDSKLAPLANAVICRAHQLGSEKTVRRAFEAMVRTETGDTFGSTLALFLQSNPGLLDDKTIATVVESDLSASQVQAVLSVLRRSFDDKTWLKTKSGKKCVMSVIDLVTSYGILHPVWYKATRATLYGGTVFPEEMTLQQHAKEAIDRLQDGLRNWLGPNRKMAIDRITAKEYKWADVVTFDSSVDEQDKQRIRKCIESVPLIREAIFLFTERTLVRLQDVSPRGIWISYLGERNGKAVYRVSTHTHHYGAFDLAINVNKSLTEEQVTSEVTWLVLAGAADGRGKLVEDFGGYWPEFGLWTEEFIAGETVSKYLAKIDRRQEEDGMRRMELLWPYLVWNGLSAYVDFWSRTGGKLQVSDPTPDNVIVPPHDYHVGSRIVSISNRAPFDGLVEMIQSFHRNFIETVEREYGDLRGKCGWNVLLSAFVEVLGEKEGLRLLRGALTSLSKDTKSSQSRLLQKKIKTFVNSVRSKGFQPQRLHFAIRRFQRWLQLNPGATPQAEMQTLQDIYTTYGLDALDRDQPGLRIQYFRDTVFAQSDDKLRSSLDQLWRTLRDRGLKYEELREKVSELSDLLNFSEREQSFLARMTYPHLQPTDTAQLMSITATSGQKADLVVFLEDQDGAQFSIRHPASVKEIARLHRLFEYANLPVEFRPEHNYLIALNDRSEVTGGLFYIQVDPQVAHLEKIVVAERHRKKGISEGLLNEFFSRLSGHGTRVVTVGFFRPEFFYKFGFKLDQSYGNLVKKLEPPDRSELAKPPPEPL